MTLIPRTVFWRTFWAQMLLMFAVVVLSIAFVASKQAENTAEEMAALWGPALQEVLARAAPSAAQSATSALPLTDNVRVVRDISIVRGAPPEDAIIPRGSARFRWLQRALRDAGIPVADLRVSGVSGDSIVWLNLSSTEDAPRWLGVISTIEGEDLPRRALIVLVLCLCVSAVLAALISRMIAKPARMIADAVRSDATMGAKLLPTRGAAEIMTIADSVADTLAARRALERERQLMLSGISHDIRSPLARIRLAAQLLPDASVTNMERDATAELAHLPELRERIERNVEIIDALVDAFSQYLRIDHDALQDESIETINVRSLIEDVLIAEGMTQVVQVNTPKETISVRGRYTLLFRALTNLIDNANTHGKPPIRIDARISPSEIAIDVLDCGGEIPAEDIERLKKPFERGEAHRGKPGSGLGLAIVARVAERHGGRLELASRAMPAPHEGTRASLVLARE
jgi:two-component system, OmpR family, osmolarity sensor histidine kinase EnvZ